MKNRVVWYHRSSGKASALTHNRINEFARQNGLEIVHIIEEVAAGGDPAEREPFREAQRMVASGVAEAMLVEGLDHITRHPKYLEAILESTPLVIVDIRRDTRNQSEREDLSKWIGLTVCVSDAVADGMPEYPSELGPPFFQASEHTTTSDDDVPAWAAARGPGGREHYLDVLKLVKEYVEARGYHGKWKDGCIVVPETVNRGRICIQSLVQSCSPDEPEAWPAMVGRFFDTFLALDSNAVSGIFEMMLDLDKVRSLVKVRLHPDPYGVEVQPHLLRKTYAPGLVGHLVVDLERINASISPDLLDIWGMSLEDAFALGVENVRKGERLKSVEGLPHEDVPVTLYQGDSYASTRALFFEDYLPASEFGTLIAIPTRNQIVTHQIRADALVLAMAVMSELAELIYINGPGSTTSQLYWWKNGQLQAATVKSEGRTCVAPTFYNEVWLPIFALHVSDGCNAFSYSLQDGVKINGLKVRSH